MVAICRVDGFGYYLGETVEIGADDGCPAGWARIAPPALDEGQHARLIEGAWAVTPDPPPVVAEPLPAEVPMHKIEKAARITPWPGYDSLHDAILAAFAALPAPQNVLALTEYNRAANFVTEGLTTQATKAALGMTDGEFRTLVLLAASMA